MKNPYQVQLAKILKIKKEAEGIRLFRLKFKNERIQEGFKFSPGQFIELSIPGFGEAPFAICSSPFEKNFFEICVRKIGQVTGRLHSLKKDDVVGIRGPYGRGWPIKNQKFEGNNLLLVAGGLGLIPLRPLILAKEKLFGKGTKIQVFYGARSPKDFLFKDEYGKWKKEIDFQITIDQPHPKWKGHAGLITTLFDKVKIVENAQAFLCGPPIMYRFVLEKLKEHNFKPKDIFMSLERRMHCGIGICQHCAIGPKYVCKDGPVFSWEELKDIPGAI